MKIWNLDKKEKVSYWCDDFKKVGKIHKNHFLAYGNLLAEKYGFFYKSYPLKISNFVKNEKVSSWCNDFKRIRNPKKAIFSAYGKLLAEKHVFF